MRNLFILLLLITFFSCSKKVISEVVVKNPDFKSLSYAKFYEEEDQVTISTSFKNEGEIILPPLTEIKSNIGDMFCKKVKELHITNSSTGYNLEGLDYYPNIQSLKLDFLPSEKDLSLISRLKKLEVVVFYDKAVDLKKIEAFNAQRLIFKGEIKDLSIFKTLAPSVHTISFDVDKDIISKEEYDIFYEEMRNKVDIVYHAFYISPY